MADQLSLRGGTTAEHATFTGANKEVTVDTTKKTLVVNDGATVGGHPLMRENASNSALALGSAGTPSLKFTGDTNTGIYSPGADQVGIATNGSSRMTVSTTAVTSTLPVLVTASGTTSIVSNLAITSGELGSRSVAISDSTSNDALIYGSNAGSLNLQGGATQRGAGIRITGRLRGTDPATIQFFTEGTSNSLSSFERLRITSTGLVGIGSSAPDSYSANNLVIAGTGARGLTIASTDSNNCNIYFADGTSGSAAFRGIVRYSHSDDYMRFFTSGSEALVIDSSGRLLVGTSTSTTARRLQVEGTDVDGSSLSVRRNANSTASPMIQISKSRGTAAGSYTTVLQDDSLGQINFYGANGTSDLNAARIEALVDGEPNTGGDTSDMPGRLVFSTTADGASSPTERMRLNSSGQLLVGTSSNFDGSTLQVNGNISQSSIFQQYAASFSGGDISTKTLNITVNNSSTYATSLVEVKGSFARGTSSRRYYYQASFAIEETGATVSSLFGESADGVTASLSFSGQTASLVLTFSTVIKLGAVSVASINSSAAQYLTSVSWA